MSVVVSIAFFSFGFVYEDCITDRQTKQEQYSVVSVRWSVVS